MKLLRSFLASAPEPGDIALRVFGAVIVIWIAVSLTSCAAAGEILSQPPTAGPDFRQAEQIENLAKHPELADRLQELAVPQDGKWHYSAGVSRTGFSIAFEHSIPFEVKRRRKPAAIGDSPTGDLPPWTEPTPIPGSGRPFVLRPPRPIKPEPPEA